MVSGTPTIFADPKVRALIKQFYPYQRRLVFDEGRFQWCNWSRQIGKSTAATMRRLLRGIARRRNQLLLSGSERQSKELMAKMAEHCNDIGFAVGEPEAELFGILDGIEITRLEIAIPSVPMRIIGLPANPLTVRGFSGDVLLDEFGMHRYDREVWASIFPSILRGEGELDVLSTPRGKQNKFYELGDNDMYNRSTVTIVDAVEQGLEADIETLRAAVGDDLIWRQEFMCEFLDEATAWLTIDLIRSCERAQLPYELNVGELEALTRRDVVVGVDVARLRDLTVIWVLEQSGTQLLTRGLIEIRGMPFAGQYELLSRILRCRCVRRMCIDATGMSMQLGEDLVREFGAYTVDPINFTPGMKEQMAGKMRARMEEGRVEIPADKAIRDDLHSVEKSVTQHGRITLRSPREGGSHADRFWALALAVWAAADDTGPVEGIVGEPLAAVGIRDW